MIKKIKNKIGQEEMVGFALIVIIVAVIMLVFLSLSFSKRNTQTVQSYEVQSFLTTALQYTTNCEFYREGYVSVENLMFKCYENKSCVNGNNGCGVLVTTLKEMLNESWKAGSDKPVQGYVLNISVNGQPLKGFKEGNTTSTNSRGATILRDKGSASLAVSFNVYG